MKRSTLTMLAAVVVLGAAAVVGYRFGFVPNLLAPEQPASKASLEPAHRFRAGDLEIGITTDPATPTVGENRLMVQLEGSGGAPLAGLAVDAYAEMPAMGAMPAMRAPAGLRETGPGRYEGTLDLSMRGEWPLTVTVDRPARDPLRMQFDLATDRAELPVATGAEPIGSAGAPAAADADGALPAFRSGPFEIAVGIEPRVARVGDNALVVEVRDAEGAPAGGVDVEAFAEMPAMGAMPAMRAPAGLRPTAPGRYEGSMNLSMRGEWPLTVSVRRADGAERRLKFDLATDREGLTLAAGGAPVGGAAMPTGSELAITIDNRRRQLIGLETGEVTHRDMVRTIRAVGEVAFDERLLSQVALKFDGYIGELRADYVGAPVKKGEVLFTVYSPELLAAQREFLETLQRRGDGARGGGLLRAARQRLALWDMSEPDIDALATRGEPRDYVPILAPRGGTVIERNVADGSAAKTGQTLLTIADLSRLWVEAEVYEADLELVRPGMRATVVLPYLPGRTWPAIVEYVYPWLDRDSRTGRVRFSLDNADGALKPDMYAQVKLEAPLGHLLAVPEEAVIVAGESRVVFRDLGGGRLDPVRIRTGRRAQGWVEVLDGLALGDRVVTSGNFLVAAETRLKTGLEQW